MTVTIWKEANSAGDKAAVLFNKGLQRYAVMVTDAGREFVVPLKEEQIFRMALSSIEFIADRQTAKKVKEMLVKDLTHYGKVNE